MKNNIILLPCFAILLLLCYSLFWLQSDVGRYTIFLQEQFDYSGKHNNDHAILLDTKTGTIWTYHSKGSYEPKKWHKEEFGK